MYWSKGVKPAKVSGPRTSSAKDSPTALVTCPSTTVGTPAMPSSPPVWLLKMNVSWTSAPATDSVASAK